MPLPETMKPGELITFDVVKRPHNAAERKTLRRLMRLDPDIKRKLSGAQRHRELNTPVRSRGKRPWIGRMKAAKFARPEMGQRWSIVYAPQLRGDLESIERLVKAS